MKYFVALLLAIVLPGQTLAVATPPELQGKTVELIVPYPPGGGTDSMQRIVAEQARQISGINFVVINRPGALGAIGAASVSKAAGDGLTLLAHANETFVINPLLAETNTVDISKLRPVSIHALTPQFFYTGYNNDIRTIQDLVQRAKSGKKFTVGFSTSHMQIYMTEFFHALGVKPYMVRYKGVAEMARDAWAGDIDLFGSDGISGQAHVEGQRVRAIATTWSKTLSIYPDAVPAATVVPDFRTYNIQMITAPSDTPAHIVQFYNQLFRQAMKTSAAQVRWQQLQIIPQDLDTAAAELFVTKERAKAKEVFKLIP